MRGDLTVIGIAYEVPCRVAASATRYEVGEPLELNSLTLSSGVASGNTAVLAAEDGIVIGTDTFRGVARSLCRPFFTGTVVAHRAVGTCPVPHLGRIRGRAETTASIDTTSELIGVIEDVTLYDYNATGAVDGGELYLIKDATADTSAFTIVDGSVAALTLDVTVDGRAYRLANDIS